MLSCVDDKGDDDRGTGLLSCFVMTEGQAFCHDRGTGLLSWAFCHGPFVMEQRGFVRPAVPML